MKSDSFLGEIASVILEHKHDPANLCVVFPNKRARLYLSRYIGSITAKPVWAPRYYTISELMEKISGCQVPDRLTLLFTLYETYIRVTGSDETFDTFYPYGESLLADFDEIDKYLVRAEDLYRNLSDLKNLDNRFNYLSNDQLEYIRKFWSTFSTTEPEGGQKNFLSLWQSLPMVYREFRNSLSSKNLAYEGMMYRKSVEDDTLIHSAFDDITRFLFVGFNALSASEEKLFSDLRNSGKADFYWDFDTSYLDPVHEAGTFIRRNILLFPEKQELNHNHFENPKEKIFFVPVFSNSGQALVIPGLLEKMEVNDPVLLQNTAIVLADEGLLIHVLHSIPGSINDINVTMGYPLSDSAVFSLIDSLYDLNRNSRVNSSGETMWYFSDIMSVMNNPLLRRKYTVTAEKIRQYALNRHLVYLSFTSEIEGFRKDMIFNEQLRTDTARYLLDLVTSLIKEASADHQKNSGDPVQLELLFAVFTWLSRLNDILEEQAVKPSSDTLFRLTRKILRSTRIPFSGEPLAGMQVLGILETRTLDFDNVIVISANEGILPGSNDRPSFIPYNLRAGFGMPTAEHNDAIYSYYFYRLIQRARKLALVYDASTGGLRTGERSRFLHQLRYDLNLKIEEIQVKSEISKIAVKPVVIPKTREVVEALSAYLNSNEKTLSPSAINEFLNCPVKFYFHYMAGLKQPEDITEDVDARLFGNLIHNALHRIYQSFGGLVTADKIKQIISDEPEVFRIIDQAFCEELFNDKEGRTGRKPEGYNLIVRQVIYTYIRQFLKTEIKSAPFSILSLEEKHYMPVNFTVNGEIKTVKTGGVIDRIDRKDGRIRILDYKTGDIKNKFPSVDSLFDEAEKNRNDAVFQVLLYCHVYKWSNNAEDIQPGLFFLRDCHNESFSEWISMDTMRLESFSSIEKEFEDRLNQTLSNLFDPAIPFRQTAVTRICSYCAYAGICRR